VVSVLKNNLACLIGIIMLALLQAGCSSTGSSSLALRNDSAWPVQVHVIYWDGNEKRTVLIKPCEKKDIDVSGDMRRQVSSILLEGGDRSLALYLDDKMIANYRDMLKANPHLLVSVTREGTTTKPEADPCHIKPKD